MADFPYVTEVDSDLKAIGRLQFESPYVYLSGPNGSGKTAVLQAIQLALDGGVDDLGFRDSARDTAMLLHLAAADRLTSHVQLSTGETAEYAVVAGKKAKHSLPGIPLFFPMAEVNDALRGSKEKALLFFLRRFLDGRDLTSTVPTLDAPQESFLEDVSKGADLCDPAVLPLVYAEVKQLALEAKQAAGLLTKAANTLQPEPVDATRAFATSMQALLRHQVAGAFTKCAVCGDAHKVDVFRERLDKVEATVAKQGGAVVDVAAHVGLLQAQAADYTERQDLAETTLGILRDWVERAVGLASKRIHTALSDYAQPRAMPRFEVTPKLLVAGITRGVEKSSRIWPCASGAEWASLEGAFAAVAAARFKGLSVMMIPDRAFDTDTLRALQLVLKRVRANVFIQAPLRPRGRPAAGWHHIELGVQVTE